MTRTISSARFQKSVVSFFHFQKPQGKPSGVQTFTSTEAMCYDSISRKDSTSSLRHDCRPFKRPVDKTAAAAISHPLHSGVFEQQWRTIDAGCVGADVEVQPTSPC